MPIAQTGVDASRLQLERVLASPLFFRNERMCRFLRFLADWHLEGRDSQLKESVIAVEVFGRKPDHDPSHDSIVRTEAGRLRARLAEYYLDERQTTTVYRAAEGRVHTGVPVPRTEAPKARSGQGKTRRADLAYRRGVDSARGPGSPDLVPDSHGVRRIAIAVLPLENLSHDPGSDYFADGLTDELIRNFRLSPDRRAFTLAPALRPSHSRANRGTCGRWVGNWMWIMSWKVPSCGAATSRYALDAQLVRSSRRFPAVVGDARTES